MATKKGSYRLHVRRYPEGRFVTVWLEKGRGKDGPWSGVLFGELPPGAAAELAQVIHAPVFEETCPLEGTEPQTTPGCEPFSTQQELFPE